jgi:hypothetical protein
VEHWEEEEEETADGQMAMKQRKKEMIQYGWVRRDLEMSKMKQMMQRMAT